ncbi:hypothetical protein QBC39DRAFT_68924 [Podospora conica]|nr:hypothetical protein QBC39DRAFT_68924 [Schizothecium conicum]
MAAPQGPAHQPFRRPPLPPTSPRGRPAPKRSRSDLGPLDRADNDSPPFQKRRQCSREDYVQGGHGGDHHDIGGPGPRVLTDSYRPDVNDEHDRRQYHEGSHSDDDGADDDDAYDDEGDSNVDAHGSKPLVPRLGNHRVLPRGGLQIRGSASARENAPHPGIKQEPEQYDGPRSLPTHRHSLWQDSDYDNTIFTNLPAQFVGPFESIVRALDKFYPDLDYSQGPKYARIATREAYKCLRHLAGITHTLNNRRGVPNPKTVEDLRRQVADAAEKNEALTAEIRSLKHEADLAGIKKDREAAAREAAIRKEHKTSMTKKTVELMANVERLEREVQAKKEERVKLEAKLEQLEKGTQAVVAKKTAELVANVERLEREVQAKREDRAQLVARLEPLEKGAQSEKEAQADKARLAESVTRLEGEVQTATDDKAKLVQNIERLEKDIQAANDDKAKLVKNVERLEKDIQTEKDDKAKLEAMAERTVKERDSLAIRREEQTQKADKSVPGPGRNPDTNAWVPVLEVKKLQNTINQLRDRKEENVGLRTKNKTLAEENNRLREQVPRLLGEISRLVRDIDRLNERVGALTRDGDDLIREKETLNERIRGLASEKQKFKSQVLTLQESNDELRGKIKNLTAEKDDLVKESKGLASEKDTLAKSNQVLQALKEQVVALSTKVLALSEEKSTLAKSNKSLDNQVMDLNTKVYTLAEENKGLVGDKETFVKENKDLSDKLLTVTQTKEKYIATVNNLTDERNSLLRLITQKDLELQGLRTRAVSAAQQQIGEAGGSARESSPYIKQENRHFQLPTPTTASGPGLPRSASRAISIDTLPSPSPGPGGEVQTMALPPPQPAPLTLSYHFHKRLSFLIQKVLEMKLASNVVIDFVTNDILSRIAVDTCPPTVTQAKEHWEVQESWLTGEAVALQARVLHVTNTETIDERFLRLCFLVEQIRTPQPTSPESPHLPAAAIPIVAASLMKSDFSSCPATAMAFLETMRSLPLPPPAAGQAFSTRRAALALIVCELCRVLERSLPDAKRSIWKIGSILGPDAQAAAEKFPIGKLADNLSYGPSPHMTKTHLATECGDRFCLLPVPGVGGSPDREIGLLYPGGESREDEGEDGHYFLMIDFANRALRLVDGELGDMKVIRGSKKSDLTISRDEGGSEVELFHVPAAPRKVIVFWVNYVQGFK